MQLDLGRRGAGRDVEDHLAVEGVPRVDLLVDGRAVLEVDRGLAVRRELLILGIEELGVVAEEALRLVADVGEVTSTTQNCPCALVLKYSLPISVRLQSTPLTTKLKSPSAAGCPMPGSEDSASSLTGSSAAAGASAGASEFVSVFVLVRQHPSRSPCSPHRQQSWRYR